MNIDNITFIQINKNYWNHLNKQQRRLLMFHELSHDIFNLEHFDIELMNTPIPDEYLITDAYVNKVMKELVKTLKRKDMSDRKLKNNGKGTFFGNLLRGLVKTGKQLSPVFDAVTGGKVSDIVKAIGGSKELTDIEKEMLI